MNRSYRHGLSVFSAAALLSSLALASQVSAQQVASVLDLQPLAVKTTTTVDGKRLMLTDLNPTVARWYLYEVQSGDKLEQYNLETPDGVSLKLDTDLGRLTAIQGTRTKVCAVEGVDAPGVTGPYVPLCGGAVWVRRVTHGARTITEAATDLLRQGGSAGEFLINFYKNNFNDTAENVDYGTVASPTTRAADAPPSAVLGHGFAGRVVGMGGLDIPIDGSPDGRVRLGHWYPAHGVPGVFATIMTPDAAVGGSTDKGGSSVDLVAFDMSRYQVRYAVGTDHPALNWSDRAPLPHNGGGPDGFGDAAPLVRAGIVPPWERPMLAGVISGGFKREHAAFKAGPMIGVHYGFAEDGVVLSRLQPGLMTFYAGLDGMPVMRTWTAEDAKKPLRGILFARQTGYALIENGEIGPHVNDVNGNWSGSNEGHLFTMRSGACTLPTPSGHTFLVYGVFTGATPAHMAAVFKALGCSAAVHLDANSPTLTYAAAFQHTKSGLVALHLNKGMPAADPRDHYKYVDVSDNRDFFYLLHR